jgi:hypothetical protein
MGLNTDPVDSATGTTEHALLDLANAIDGPNTVSFAPTPAQTAAPATAQATCATTPEAPGCTDLASMARGLADILQTCTRQPEAGVCPEVIGSDVRPPANLLDLTQLQNNVPTDRLWLWEPGSRNWVGITPAVAENCDTQREAPGCSGVREVLGSVGGLQSVCRDQPGSPACGAPAAQAGQGPELTTGTPTTTSGPTPMVFHYIDVNATVQGGGTFTLADTQAATTIVGPQQPRTGPPEPASLFRFQNMDLSGTPAPVTNLVPFTRYVDMSFTRGGTFTIPTLTTPAVPSIDVVESADTFQVSPGGLNQAIQIMVIVTINQVLQQGGKNDDDAAPYDFLPVVSWGASGRRPFLARAVAGEYRARTREVLPPPPGLQQKSPVQLFLTSLGTSTGEAFELQAFSAGGAPVQLRAEGLVVQPLNAQVTRRTQQELQKQARSAGGRAATRLDAYCLEFLRQPPAKGMMFQVAGNSLQQKFAPVRRILEASRLVRAAGGLTPDSEPEGYFHSIRQWAIWTREQGFNQRTYGDAFAGHTRKNFEQAGGKWTDAVEKVVRNVVPNRWNDISKILQRAGAP